MFFRGASTFGFSMAKTDCNFTNTGVGVNSAGDGTLNFAMAKRLILDKKSDLSVSKSVVVGVLQRIPFFLFCERADEGDNFHEIFTNCNSKTLSCRVLVVDADKEFLGIRRPWWLGGGGSRCGRLSRIGCLKS